MFQRLLSGAVAAVWLACGVYWAAYWATVGVTALFAEDAPDSPPPRELPVKNVFLELPP